MIHRLALLIGSVAAAAILALGFAATGFGPNAAPADAEQPTAALAAAAAAAASAAPVTDLPTAKPITRIKTTTVYVRAAPKPKVIHVTRRAPAPVVRRAPAKKHVKIVHVTKNTGGGSDDGSDDGHDGGGEQEPGDD